MEEQLTLNQWVTGSSPVRLTFRGIIDTDLGVFSLFAHHIITIKSQLTFLVKTCFAPAPENFFTGARK